MKAADAMVTAVFKVKEKDTVREALESFVRHKISGLPVVNERNEVVGFLSDGDIMRWVGKHKPHIVDAFFYIAFWEDNVDTAAKFQALLAKNVMELATRKVIAVNVDTPLGEVAAILGEKRIKKVVVVQDRVLKGIISRGDMIRFLTSHYLNNMGKS